MALKYDGLALALDDESIMACCLKKNTVAGFFTTQTSVVLDERYFLMQLTQLNAIQPLDNLLLADLDHLIHCIKQLKKSIRHQKDLDDLANILGATHRYLHGQIATDEFKTQVASLGVHIEKHRTFETVSYIAAAILTFVAGTTSIGLSTGCTLLILALAAVLAMFGHQHAKDPNRILGDALLNIIEHPNVSIREEHFEIYKNIF